jgi:hypothetical protein
LAAVIAIVMVQLAQEANDATKRPNDENYRIFVSASRCRLDNSVGKTTSNSTIKLPSAVIPSPLIFFLAPLKMIVVVLFITIVFPFK